MKVFIEKQSKEMTIRFSGSVEKLLKKLRINHEEVLVVRDGALLTKDTKLQGNDSIRLLSVVSGG
jgi:sulfur carrier protein ThiS